MGFTVIKKRRGRPTKYPTGYPDSFTVEEIRMAQKEAQLEYDLRFAGMSQIEIDEEIELDRRHNAEIEEMELTRPDLGIEIELDMMLKNEVLADALRRETDKRKALEEKIIEGKPPRKSYPPPLGDVRLNTNLNKKAYDKLKKMSLDKNITLGKLLEILINKYLP